MTDYARLTAATTELTAAVAEVTGYLGPPPPPTPPSDIPLLAEGGTWDGRKFLEDGSYGVHTLTGGSATDNHPKLQLKAKPLGRSYVMCGIGGQNVYFPLIPAEAPTDWGAGLVFGRTGPDAEGFWSLSLEAAVWPGAGFVLTLGTAQGVAYQGLNGEAAVEIKELTYAGGSVGTVPTPTPPPTPPSEPPPTPTPTPPVGYDPVAGKTVVFEDHFTILRRDVWYAGGKPTVDPDGGQYGRAYFAPWGYGDHDPFSIVDGTILRIRAKWMGPTWTDPRGWGANDPTFKWISGHLATARPDGSASFSRRKGYFEMRAKMPKGAGCWSSLWLEDQNCILHGAQDGAIELDVVEAYGHDGTAYMATEHRWAAPSLGDTYVRYAKHIEDLGGVADYTTDFHLWGAEVTDTQVIYHFDRREVYRAPLERASFVTPFFAMVTLAISHDWPAPVPEQGYHDLLVDYVRVYA
jgi:hypothetical protein